MLKDACDVVRELYAPVSSNSASTFMLAHVNTLAFFGITGKKIDTQVHMANGLPCFNIVGLPDKAVAESRERVRAAFSSIGLGLPNKRITVHLAPADLPKIGSHFDLPIALGLLIAMQILPQEEISGYFTMGELALDGSITAVNGVLLAAILAHSHSCGLICPKDNAAESMWSGNEDVIAPQTLLELIQHFTGQTQLQTPHAPTTTDDVGHTYPDLHDIKGQTKAKRALEISAAGNHNILMIGPPGSGKSMLAKRLPGIMPPMTTRERLEASIIASIAGKLHKTCGLVSQRPFREPHSSCSTAAMVGGGQNSVPGEITFAHLGVLFLDELPEFGRAVLDGLRQPLESGSVTVARVNNHVTYPSRFLLVAAMNPCKCGYYGSMGHSCNKAPRCVEEYQSRVSGPIYDRFDLQITVSPTNPFTDHDCCHGTPTYEVNQGGTERYKNSAVVAQRVMQARALQNERYKDTNCRTNSELEGELLESVVQLDVKGRHLLEEAVNKMSLSMRGINKIMRVARTIADLAAQQMVSHLDVAEAINFRVSRIRK